MKDDTTTHFDLEIEGLDFGTLTMAIDKVNNKINKNSRWVDNEEDRSILLEPARETSSGLIAYGAEDPFFHSRMPKTVHWSVPWSDLMMTMFILFAVMFIYQISNKEILPKGEIGAEIDPAVGNESTIGEGDEDLSGSPSINKIYNLSKETLRAQNLESFASVELVPDKAVRIILTGDLFFDTGKAELKPNAKKSLRKIANIILQTPYLVSVIGHTDNVPIHTEKFPTNWELSANRACVVVRFLIDEMKIPAKRFYISGHSYNQPVKPNNTIENRSANRRVEIIILKERPYDMPISVGNISSRR